MGDPEKEKGGHGDQLGMKEGREEGRKEGDREGEGEESQEMRQDDLMRASPRRTIEKEKKTNRTSRWSHSSLLNCKRQIHVHTLLVDRR